MKRKKILKKKTQPTVLMTKQPYETAKKTRMITTNDLPKPPRKKDPNPSEVLLGPSTVAELN